MNTTTEKLPIEMYALVELMGHQKIAGLVTETNIAGTGMLRVDVPNEKGETDFTRFYSPSAVYCINPVSKQIAIGLALKLQAAPVEEYDLVKLGRDKKGLGWNEPGHDAQEEDFQ